MTCTRRETRLEPEYPDSRQQILIFSSPTWPLGAGFFTSMVLSIMMCIVTLYVVAAVVDIKFAAVDCDGLILFVFLWRPGLPC